jgi:hypothetical protein
MMHLIHISHLANSIKKITIIPLFLPKYGSPAVMVHIALDNKERVKDQHPIDRLQEVELALPMCNRYCIETRLLF